MSQTRTPDGAGHRDVVPARHERASGPRRAIGSSPTGPRRLGGVPLVAGSVLYLHHDDLAAAARLGLPPHETPTTF